jgi:hypothetical protein
MKKSIIIIIIFTSSCFCFSETDPHLIHHWIFDATHISGNVVKDLAGNYDAILEGPIRFIPGSKDRGLEIDNNNYIVMSDNIPLSNVPQKEITVEAWVNVSWGSRWYPIIGMFHDLGSGEQGWGWQLGCMGNFFYFSLSSQDSKIENNSALHLLSKSRFEDEKWYHVAATYDGSIQKIYVNGELENSSAIQNGDILYKENTPFVICKHQEADLLFPFYGRILECKIYHRALSQYELQQNYTSPIMLPQIPIVSKETRNTVSYPKAPGIQRTWAENFHNFSISPYGNLLLSSKKFLDGYKIHQMGDDYNPIL